MLELPRNCFDEIVAHALDGLPNEMCGLVIGKFGSDRVERFVPLRNAAESPIFYEIDSAEWAANEDAADREGLAILGVVHSHTKTTAYPSPTDVRQAGITDPFGVLRYLIVSLKHTQPSLRSFTIVGEEVSEETLTVSLTS